MAWYNDLWNGLSSAAMWAHNNIGLGAADKVLHDLVGTSPVPSALGYNGDGDSYLTPAQRQHINDRNWQAQREDLAYERTMDASNTAYQRGAADLKAAGLNPAMVYTAGGASSPNFTANSYADMSSIVQQGANARLSALTHLAAFAISKM